MNKRKYLVIPGYVYSKHDYDKHWIDEHKLMRLYGVSPKDCIIDREQPGSHNTFVQHIRKEGFKSILRPRQSGDYIL